MEKRLHFSVGEIFEKQFNVDFKGYAAKEVDEFLDLVIRDYETYDQIIKELGERLQLFEAKHQALTNQIVELEGRSNYKEQPNPNNTVDILKRLSRLEAAVFK
ncbi:MAG: DivIVA domain-containing protein [Erysipelotrichaceae bacterium]